MKTLCAVIAFLPFVSPLYADFKLPKDVLRMAQYEDALKQGVEQKKPVALILFDEEDVSKGAEPIIEEAIKSARGWSILVLVSTCKRHEEGSSMPPPALGLNQESADIKLPKILIISPREDIAWKVIGSANAKGTPAELKKEFKTQAAAAKQEFAPYFAAKTPPPFKSPGDKPVYWGMEDGKYGLGTFIRVDGENLMVKDKEGKEGGIEMSKLKPASARYAKTLAGLTDAPAAAGAEAKPAGPEKWTNSKGKEIEATFVKLADGKVTLRLTTGRDYTLALAELSAGSQARAKELAGGKK